MSAETQTQRWTVERIAAREVQADEVIFSINMGATFEPVLWTTEADGVVTFGFAGEGTEEFASDEPTLRVIRDA